jgi:bacillithiol synthase
MVQSIRIRDLPSSSRLYADCWDGTEAVRGLIPRHFRDPGAFMEQAARVGAQSYARGTLRAVLAEQNERFGAGPEALRRIGQLEDPASVVVIGGQQAGLFGGPLYTLHKALTVLSLARRQEELLGRPVVPVFWIASEDSDLAEIDHAFFTDAEGGLRELRLPDASREKVPVSRVRLGEGVTDLIGECAGLLPSGGFAEEVIADLRAAYSPGRTYPQAFGAWMARVFREWGLVLADPSDARLKRIAQPLFEREIRDGSPVSTAVMEQTLRVRAAGYPPQIELRPGYLTLFHQDPAREAITVDGDRLALKTSGRRFTRAELAGLLRDDPDAFTPNAVLRPLFQDTLFPTLAVVLGPAEIAYFSQLTLAYAAMDIPMPLIVPRASLTLVEEKMEGLRARLDVGLPRLLERGERVIDDILSRRVPESLAARVAEGRTRVADAWRGIVAEIDSLDPTLHRTAVLGSSRSLGQLDFMERKILKAARRRDELLRTQVRKLASSLAPRGGLQERTLCAPPLLARQGPGLLARAFEAIDPFAAEHRVLVVEP